jgi:hypothetical protein
MMAIVTRGCLGIQTSFLLADGASVSIKRAKKLTAGLNYGNGGEKIGKNWPDFLLW